MAKFKRRNRAHPTNDCLRQTTLPAELYTGPECERDITGNEPLPEDGYDGYGDGYDGYKQFQFLPEDPSKPVEGDGTSTFKSQDVAGYHRYTVNDVFRGFTETGECASPYSRGVLGSGEDGGPGGFNGVIQDRQEQLLQTTGRSVTLLRRQFTGPICPCKSTNRGRSRTKCVICFGTSFVPGYIPYVNQSDPLGRIRVRFEPFTEDTPQKEQGVFQEVTISAWTLAAPIIRKRDIMIVYTEQGEEEFRYEVHNVTRNDLFGGVKGAQKFTLKRIDPNQVVYNYDPFKIPDLADISVDLSDLTLEGERIYEQLGTEDDGQFPNVVIESAFGDSAFAGMFTEGYKCGYEINFRRILEFKQPLWQPDFNEDGTVDDGYGPIFTDSNGKVIRFSTPQMIEPNLGVNPLEVIAAEKKRNFLHGFTSGAKHGVLDAENELRARGLL